MAKFEDSSEKGAELQVLDDRLRASALADPERDEAVQLVGLPLAQRWLRLVGASGAARAASENFAL